MHNIKFLKVFFIFLSVVQHKVKKIIIITFVFIINYQKIIFCLKFVKRVFELENHFFFCFKYQKKYFQETGLISSFTSPRPHHITFHIIIIISVFLVGLAFTNQSPILFVYDLDSFCWVMLLLIYRIR